MPANQSELLWRRSSACNPTECVEVAFDHNRVLVRDSKRRGPAILEFTHAQWQSFIADRSRWNVLGHE